MTVPPLALLFICAVAAYLLAQFLPLYSFNAPLWLVGFEMVAALAFLLPALFGFRKHETTVNPISPDAATALVTDGVYGITRNPMYVGMLLALLGVVFWLGAVSALAMVVAFYFIIDRNQIAVEERALLNKFGKTYRDYAERVPRWLLIRQGVAQ